MDIKGKTIDCFWQYTFFIKFKLFDFFNDLHIIKLV